jgi:phospholipid/cholesterol/gamma-HCH transport system permease protein
MDSTFGVFPKDIYTGLFKSLVFGITLSTIGCAQGLRAKGGALGVGRATRNTVVISFVMIIILSYFITWIFYH